jgi:hypothetical protein
MNAGTCRCEVIISPSFYSQVVIHWRAICGGGYVSLVSIDSVTEKTQPTERLEGKTIAVINENG